MYIDTETGENITAEELLNFYNDNRDDIFLDSGAESFVEYLNNCLDKNGFLEEIRNE